MDYLEFIDRATSHIPDKGQVMACYYGMYANAHRGKTRKAGLSPLALRMSEEELKPVPTKGWAAMIRKVCEVDPMVCPKCGSLSSFGRRGEAFRLNSLFGAVARGC